jgi:RHS repeat-associated protein
VHLFEGERRVLLVDDVVRAAVATRQRTLFRYQYGNHLASVGVELDDDARVISYEEFHPHGTSAYRLLSSAVEVPARRYRYTGMERDEESGLAYHGARYYAPSLGRWLSADPIGHDLFNSQYAYVLANVVKSADRAGTAPPSAETVDLLTRGRNILAGPNTHLDRKTALSLLAEAQSGGVYNEVRGRLYNHLAAINADADNAQAYLGRVNSYLGTAEGLSAESRAELAQLSNQVQTSIDVARQQTIPTLELLAGDAAYSTRLAGTAFRGGQLVANNLEQIAERVGTPLTLLPAHQAFEGVVDAVEQLPVRSSRGAAPYVAYDVLGVLTDVEQWRNFAKTTVSLAKDAKNTVTELATKASELIDAARPTITRATVALSEASRVLRALGPIFSIGGAATAEQKLIEQSKGMPDFAKVSAIGLLIFGVGLVDDFGAGEKMVMFGDTQYISTFADSYAQTGMSPLQRDVLKWFSD